MVGDRTPDWNAALTASCSSKSCWSARMYSTAERRVSTLLIFLFAAPLGTCSRRVAKPLFTSFTRLRSLSFRLATACGCCGGKLYPKPAKLSLLLHRSSSGEDERCLFACFDADLLLHWLSVGLSWMLWDAKKQAGGMNCWWFTLISILAVKSISQSEKKGFFGVPSGRASCSWRSRVASMGKGAPDSRPALSCEMETARPFQYAGGPARVPPGHAPRDALALRTPGACRSCHWVNNFL